MGTADQVFRFGVFELDAQSGELRRHGQKVRLPDQAFQVLQVLLRRPGEVVTRDELRRQLWKPGTFVGYDVGLNSAVRKLRAALDDSSSAPELIETLPRRGYRFIGSVEVVEPAPSEPAVIIVRSAPSRVAKVAASSALAIALLIVALGIAGARGWRLRGEPARSRSVDPAATDAYLKGVFAAGQPSVERLQTAIAYFEDAIARQPDYAEAHAALGAAQLQFLFTGPFAPREVIPKAEAFTRKAIELDPALPRPHQVLGTILTHYYWKWDEGNEQLRLAKQLSAPGVRGQRVDDAVAKALRARQRDPLSINAQIDLAIAYRARSQFDRAVAEFRRALVMEPGLPRTQFQLGVTHVLSGRYDDAIRELEVVTSSSGNPRFSAYLGYAYAAAGRVDDARDVLTELVSRSRAQYVSAFGLALIHDALGERELALASIERAYEDHAVEFAQLSQYPPFRAMAGDPRYEAVIRRVTSASRRKDHRRVRHGRRPVPTESRNRGADRHRAGT
jgi:DNA-binding winged helix-turn-helix (wHTH) protein/Flp pilus assembly protein TadD